MRKRKPRSLAKAKLPAGNAGPRWNLHITAAVAGALIFLYSSLVTAETVVIGAAADNTIYENIPQNTCGAGTEIYAGQNAAGSTGLF